MNQAVWKFPIPVAEEVGIEMPVGAKILSVQNQHEKLVLWALVDPAVEKEPRYFMITGTGHRDDRADVYLVFLGTAQFASGSLVLHVFEIRPISDVVD